MLSRQRLKLAGFCFRYRPVLVIFVGHYCVTPLKFAARYDRRSCDLPDLGCTGRGGRGR